MAIFIPQVDPETIDNDGERDVARELKNLPDDCIVYHSYPWLKHGRTLYQGEADFLVLTPQGLLVLEVKGGTVSFNASTREWRSGYEGIQDPFAQATKNIYEIVDKIRKSEFNNNPHFPCPYGYAVVFPHCDWSGDLPPGAQTGVLFSAKDLPHLGTKIQKCIGLWDRSAHPTLLDGNNRKKIRTALEGTFRLLPALDRVIQNQNEKLVQLTENQEKALRGCYGNNRMFVSGPAGSGKTMLALATAKHLASQGKSVLLLCYNRFLAEWLNYLITPWVQKEQPNGSITIKSFHSLCSDWCREARINFNPPDQEPAKSEFYRNTAPSLFLDAIEIYTRKFDAVVVDEAQDFETDWWDPIESLNINGVQGTLYIFCDPKQNLYVKQEAYYPAIDSRYELTENCRNTRKISEHCSEVRGIDNCSAYTSPDGIAPTIQVEPDRDERFAAMDRQLRDWIRDGRLPASKVAILSLYRWGTAKCSVFGQMQIGGLPLINDTDQWRAGDGILIATTKSFKGLEADAVILTDVSKPFRDSDVAELYVACSRAKHLLSIFAVEEL